VVSSVRRVSANLVFVRLLVWVKLRLLKKIAGKKSHVARSLFADDIGETTGAVYSPTGPSQGEE
jgi:hypothetical protein